MRLPSRKRGRPAQALVQYVTFPLPLLLLRNLGSGTFGQQSASEAAGPWPDGCNSLTNEHDCVSHTDGRPLITAGGVPKGGRIHGEPCVWCCGSACTTSWPQNKCEPMDWLLQQEAYVGTGKSALWDTCPVDASLRSSAAAETDARQAEVEVARMEVRDVKTEWKFEENMRNQLSEDEQQLRKKYEAELSGLKREVEEEGARVEKERLEGAQLRNQLQAEEDRPGLTRYLWQWGLPLLALVGALAWKADRVRLHQNGAQSPGIWKASDGLGAVSRDYGTLGHLMNQASVSGPPKRPPLEDHAGELPNITASYFDHRL